jgi:hypothetical protein
MQGPLGESSAWLSNIRLRRNCLSRGKCTSLILAIFAEKVSNAIEANSQQKYLF